MAGAFDHHLHILFPGFAGEFAQSFEFRQLGLIRSVVQTARPQGISQAEGNIVLFEKFR